MMTISQLSFSPYIPDSYSVHETSPAHSVYALTGAEVDAWSGVSGSVGGDFILRMENGGVALVPVEDKDGDNLWVDAPNVSPKLRLHHRLIWRLLRTNSESSDY